jgi:hypothetical protein
MLRSARRLPFIGLSNFKLSALIISLFVMITSLTLAATDSAEAAYFYDVDLTTDDNYKESNRQVPAVFYITLTNTGENSDFYSVELQYTDEKETWSVSFSEHGTKSVDVYVPSGRSVFVNVTVKPDCSCEEGNTLDVYVRADSNTDDNTFDNLTIQTKYVLDYNPDDNGNTDITDTDGDGWRDEDEVYFGTNPFDPEDYPEQDTDGDGLSDDFETNWGTDPKSFDTDHDGDTDFEEYQQGTDPKDPNDNSKTKSTGNGGSDSDTKSSGSGLLGMDNDNLYFIVIPILVVIIIISLIILLYVWRTEKPNDDSKSFDKLEELYDEMVDGDLDKTGSEGKESQAAKAAAPSSRIEVLNVKPEKTPEGYKCPECGREFKQKSLKKHLLRTHHKRIKNL